MEQSNTNNTMTDHANLCQVEHYAESLMVNVGFLKEKFNNSNWNFSNTEVSKLLDKTHETLLGPLTSSYNQYREDRFTHDSDYKSRVLTDKAPLCASVGFVDEESIEKRLDTYLSLSRRLWELVKTLRKGERPWTYEERAQMELEVDNLIYSKLSHSSHHFREGRPVWWKH